MKFFCKSLPLRPVVRLLILLAVLPIFSNVAYGNTGLSGTCANLLSSRTYTVYGQTISLHQLETVPQGEPAAIESTNTAVREFFKRTYLNAGPQIDSGSQITTSGTRRGVHPKAHGTLRGKLTVNPNVDIDDRVGIFNQPGKSYEVIARFSNGNPRPNGNDSIADSRGFGLKVLGVEGDPLLKDIEGNRPGEQDFTMNSSNAFFADSAETYQRFMEIGLLETTSFGEAAKKHVFELVKHIHPLLALRVLKAFKGIQAAEATNPLAINYFSIAAFQHGASDYSPIVKYALMPCEGTWSEAIDANNPNFLRANLIKHISQKPACFRFMIQDYNPSLSIEDLTRPWSEAVSQFREIARIEFPAQDLVDELEAEQLVINPWNSLPEHKPVGGINRLRLAAYLMSIEMRTLTNRFKD